MDLSRYLDLFLGEAREHLGAAHAILSELELDSRQTERWNAFMRHAHSIKGMAATMQLPTIVSLTHAAESLAERLEAAPPEESQVYLPVLAESLACLGQLLDRVERGEEARSARAEELARMLQGDEPPATAPAAAIPAAPAAAAEDEPSSARCWQLDLQLGAAESGSAQDIVSTLGCVGRMGRVVQSVPPSLAPDPRRIVERLQLVLETDHPREEIEGALSALVGADGYAIEPAPRPARGASPAGRPAEWIRVRADVLDSIVEGVLELRQEQARLKGSVTEPGTETRHRLQRGDFLLKELYGSLMELHLVPFDSVAQRMRQTVVGLAHELDKPVQFEIAGGHVRLDRLVLETLIDPLLHALRNAVDHGLERADERRASGKPEKGRLRLSLHRGGERVTIVVADDGRGMQPELLRRTAVERGLLSAADVADLTDDESLLLATLPRLSTRREASSVSGRGVGLDVVREKLKEIGGFVEIRSEPGQGSELHLSVPLRRALIQTLLVGCGDGLYALPLDAVSKIVDLEQLAAPSAETADLRRVSLGERLGLPDRARGDAVRGRAILMANFSPRTALLVDEVIARQDLIAQPLHAPLSRLRVYSGTALLENGTIVPILDPLFLIRG